MVFSRCHGNNQLLVIQLNWTVFFLFPRGVCVCTSRKVAIYGILFVSKQFHRIFCELVLASIVHNKNHQWNYMSLHVPKLHNLVSVFFFALVWIIKRKMIIQRFMKHKQFRGVYHFSSDERMIQTAIMFDFRFVCSRQTNQKKMKIVV